MKVISRIQSQKNRPKKIEPIIKPVFGRLQGPLDSPLLMVNHFSKSQLSTYRTGQKIDSHIGSHRQGPQRPKSCEEEDLEEGAAAPQPLSAPLQEH